MKVMKEFWDVFKARCLTGETFTLDYNEDTMAFVPMKMDKLDKDIIIYRCQQTYSEIPAYEDFLSMYLYPNDTKIAAIAKDKKVYINDYYDTWIKDEDYKSEEYKRANGIISFEDYCKELNKKLKMGIKHHYNSHPLKENTELYLDEYKEEGRRAILYLNPLELPIYKDVTAKFNCDVKDCYNILCECEALWIFKRRAIRKNVEYLKDARLYNTVVEHIVNENLFVDDWELRLANGIAEVKDVNFLTVTFKIDDVTVSGKATPKKILTKLYKKELWDMFDFQTEAMGEDIIRLEEELYCKDIVEISYKGRVIYKKEN